MNRLKLVKPTMEYEEQVMAYRQAFFDSGDSFDGCGGLQDTDNYEDWLDFDNRLRVKIGEGYVPSTLFLAVRTEDNKVVGMIDFRHYLSDFLLNFGGNIGYSVLPSERRKGYAKEMLALMLGFYREFCRENGQGNTVDRVLITCDRSNPASSKTILANGGVLVYMVLGAYILLKNFG